MQRATQCTEKRVGWAVKNKECMLLNQSDTPKGRYEELGGQASEWNKPHSVTFKLSTETKWQTQP